MSVMTSPDEDSAPVPKPSSGPSPVPAEPLPAENRRLPKAAARPAPVLALLKSRWPWLVITGLLGTVLGLVLGAAQTYQATATLQLTGVTDSFRVKQVGQTAELLAVSPPVIKEAVKSEGLEGTLPEELGPRTTALWGIDTDLVDITVRNQDGPQAVREANAVVNAVVTTARNNQQAELTQVQSAVESLLSKNKLTGTTAELDRQKQVGALAADRQFKVLDAVSVAVASPAIAYLPAGASRPVSAALGGIGGIILGALAALIVGAGRRRVRTPGELRALAPELTLKSTTQAGEVAGRLLESGHSTLVVLSLPSTPSSASRFAAAVANHLRTHGSSVTLVNAIALESSDSASMALPDEVWVLRRDIRQDVKAYFSTDVLVVACTAEPEAVGLISGQSDLMAVVVAKEGRSRLQQIWDTVSAVESADPIVVLAP